MPTFVRSMLWIGLIALIVAVMMVWRSHEPSDQHPSPSTPMTSGKPIGTSTLSHGGPARATSDDPRDAAAQR